MALSNEKLIEELSNKPVMEIVDLVKALEEKWVAQRKDKLYG